MFKRKQMTIEKKNIYSFWRLDALSKNGKELSEIEEITKTVSLKKIKQN